MPSEAKYDLTKFSIVLSDRLKILKPALSVIAPPNLF